MSENKENKRNSKKIAPGIAATVNRLETSKAILNVLKNTASGNVPWLSFLKDAASSATGILASIQGIEDGEIDENFVKLGLDSCGLVYIVISKCQEEQETEGEALDQMKVGSGELTRVLYGIQEFVDKKAHRNLYKRVLKHSADGQKIVAYRDQLRKIMEMFGNPADSSIHDVLEEIIDEGLKLGRLEQKERNSRSSTPQNIADVAPIVDLPPPLPPKTFLVPPETPNERPVTPPPPEIVISTQPNEDPLATMMSNIQIQREAVSDYRLGVEDEGEKERQKNEAEAKKKKRLEDDRARKRAEKARWRKSEQTFIQLPESAPDAENQPPLTAAEKSLPLLTEKPGVIDIETDSEPELETYKTAVRATPKKAQNPPSQLDDERIAAALHARMQRELEEEDEKAAMLEAAKLQREWEAEERKNSRTAQPKRRKTRRSPIRSPTVQESPSPEVPPTASPVELLEGLMHETRRGGSDRSPRYHSQSPRPETGINPTHAPDSMMPPYGTYPQPPNPYDPDYYPGPHFSPPSVAMHNITGSAISLGGGPVSNQNSGNTHTTTIINSMNDSSVRYYLDDEDIE